MHLPSTKPRTRRGHRRISDHVWAIIGFPNIAIIVDLLEREEPRSHSMEASADVILDKPKRCKA